LWKKTVIATEENILWGNEKNAIRQASLCSIGRLHGTGVIVPKKLPGWREFSGSTQAKALSDRIP
jgi:hypothetical protein